jgi:predicted dehydrogenase
MEAMQMKVGIIGCGQIAMTHIPYVLARPDARIVGVADASEGRARELATRFRLPYVYRTLGDLLDAQRPDVVHILTPPQTHGALAMEAMEAGCHVLVEKPMAANLEEAEAMEAVARRRGVKLCVDHNHLFDPVVVRARALVEQGVIGQVVWVESFEGFDIGGSDNPYVKPGAAGHWVHQLPGGIFQNLAPHPLYLLLAFLGSPLSLQAVAQKTGRVPTAFADELRVQVNADDGLGCFMVSLSIQPFMKYVHIFGTDGTMYVNLTTNSLILLKPRRLPRALARGMRGIEEGAQLLASTVVNALRVATGRLRPYPGLGVLIAEFYRSIAEDRPPPVDSAAGREVVRLLDLVWEQIGRWQAWSPVPTQAAMTAGHCPPQPVSAMAQSAAAKPSRGSC